MPGAEDRPCKRAACLERLFAITLSISSQCSLIDFARHRKADQSNENHECFGHIGREQSYATNAE